jgi:flagellin-like protein
MLKSKKGISPILATLLLIVIAVAAIIVTYAWVMTYVGTQTQAAGTMLKTDALTWYSNRTVIAVRNTGTSDAVIIKLYMGVSQNNYTDVTSYTNIGTGITISVKNVNDVVLSWPNSLSTTWQSGQVYYFSITPNSGAAYQFEQTAP